TQAELSRLLSLEYSHYGYEFRWYSSVHITRRVRNRMFLQNFTTDDELIDKLLQSKTFAATFLKDLSTTGTVMIRDPGFYLAFREKVVPILKTYPFIKIWHAGCATGEEAYSIAILLHEEGLLERATIYATDFNQSALDSAKEGIYPSKLIKG